MDKSEFEDFKKTLKDNGLSENDFTLNDKDLTNWAPNTIVTTKGTITVRCISTKKERSYNSWSHWTVDFEKDLNQGVYN